MRHRKAGVKLNRTTSHRQAMFRNMVTSLFKHDRIRTTDVKAKELRRWADQIITLAKRGDLHARRQILAIVQEKDVAHKLFEEAGKRFGAINGGYTRIIKLGRRPGDAAPVSIIELVAAEEKVKSKKKGKGEAKKKVAETPKPSEPSTTKAADDQEPGETVEAKDEPLEAQTDQSIADDAAATDTTADSEGVAGNNVEDSEEPDKK
jgi:large subunit ribosomal protein L17